MDGIWELKSRKFRVMAYDVVISIILYFTAKYAAPAVADDINFLIGAIQPVAVAIILAISHEDGKLAEVEAAVAMASQKQVPEVSSVIVNQPESTGPEATRGS